MSHNGDQCRFIFLAKRDYVTFVYMLWQIRLVLCDTWNWSDDNDIAILDTTAIQEMRSAISMSFRIRQSQYAVYSQTVNMK